ncbi:MAG: response regulator [Pseudomonadota bacterium]
MPGIKIMVVEDEIVVAADLTAQLMELGYDTCGFAVTGEEAVNLAMSRQPDLILMDINLSGDMDGIEAAARIRRHTGIPIVFITAHADTELVKRASTIEPSGYLVKPFEPRELFANIETALYRARAEKERERLRDLRQPPCHPAWPISGFLCICSGCKMVRDEAGNWQRLEKYFQERTQILFSHSLCPDCQKRLYPELL